MKSRKKFDWLIIVFVHEIDQAGHEAEKLIKEIQKVGPGANKVFLIRDHRTEKLVNGRELIVYYHLELCELIVNEGRVVFKKIPSTETGIDTTAPDGWKKAYAFVFTRYNSLSERKMLLTWSHGSGFGINKEESTVTRELYEAFLNKFNKGLPFLIDKPITQVRNSQLFSEKNPDWVLTEKADFVKENLNDHNMFSNLRKISYENPLFVCKNLEIMWIWELAEVLERNLGNNKIDIILMVNCNMQMLDTGYMLRRNTRYLVAPETEMAWFGYDYEKLFTHLKRSPRDPLRRILSRIMRDYILKQKRDPEASQFLENSTMFINNLRHFDGLLQVLEESLVHLLSLLNKNNLSTFKTIRYQKMHSVTELGDTNSYDLIDMGRWLKLTAGYFNKSFRLKWIYFKYRLLLRKVVFKKFIGKFYEDHDRSTNARKYGISGISLFFPDHKPFTTLGNKWGDCAYYSPDTVPSPFTSVTTWDDFVKKFFEVQDTH